MPSVKQGGGYTLTFSKKNQDIKAIIETKMKTVQGFKFTDYACEAIRFYEENKNKVNSITIDNVELIEKLVQQQVEKIIGNTIAPIITSTPSSESGRELSIDLETDLDDIDVDDD